MTPTYYPPKMGIQAYTAWFSKMTRPVGRHLSESEYWRSLSILDAEFLPYCSGGITPLDEVIGTRGPDIVNKDGTVSRSYVGSRIDWKKSPGWPWVNRGCMTKAQAWEKFELEIRDMVEKLIRGEYVECVFIASEKDELLKKNKNPRIFACAPFHHNLACAVLFQKHADSLTSNFGYTASAIGMDIFAQGLSSSFHRLSEHEFAYDGDHSGWDVSYRDGEPERDFMKHGLQDEWHSGVNLLFSTAQCPRVYACGHIYQLAFQPSGWFLTTFTNTIKNYRQVCEAFMDLWFVQYGKSCTIQELRDGLKVLCGGDDLAFSTKYSWFTIAAYADWAQHRGTFCESDVLEPRNAMHLTFCSHRLYPRSVKFWPNKKLIVAGGRLDKIVASFSYLKKRRGVVDYLANAQRVVGLLVNLWAYEHVYNYLEPYALHLVYQYFLESGKILTSDWSGVFSSLPSEAKMLTLWAKGKPEGTFLPREKRLLTGVKVYQAMPVNLSVLKRPPEGLMSRKYANPVFRTIRANNNKAWAKAMSPKKKVVQARKALPGPAVVIGTTTTRKRSRRRRGRGPGRSNGSGSGGRGQFPGGNNPRGKRTAVVSQDEYITDVFGSTGFAVTTFAVNPGQAATFPWLSKEAAQWEKYRFEHLEFYYKPQVSAYATNGQSGKVILTADYDSSDPIPTTKQQMEDTDPHVDRMPYQEMALRLSAYEMRDTDAKYVRTGPQPARTDLKTYDVAKFNLGTDGNANTNVVGELHVRYTCVFSVPVLEPNAAPVNTSTSMFVSSGSSEAVTTNTAYQLLLATANTNGLNAVNTAGSIVFPLGNYFYTWTIQGSATTNWTVLTGNFDYNAGALTVDTQSQSAVAVVTNGTIGGSGWFSSNGVLANVLNVTLIGTGDRKSVV